MRESDLAVPTIPKTSSRPGAPVAKRLRLPHGLLSDIGVYVTLTVLALFCTVPFLWLFFAAFDAHATPYLQFPSQLTFQNIVHMFTESGAWQLLLNSMIMAGGAVIVVTFTCTLAGYSLSRLRFPGKRALMLGILLCRLVPPTATIVPLFSLFLFLDRFVQMTDSYQGMILVLAGYQVPLVLWILKEFFDTVPITLEEAAWIDGANRFTSAWRIVFPLALPGVAAAALFAFIGAWSEFLIPLILISSPDKEPLSIGIFRAYQNNYIVDWGQFAGLSLLYMLPAVVFFLIARRFLIRSVLAGSMAGT
jgi:multiple sugar transport system permease protein